MKVYPFVDECLSVIPTMCNELSAYLRKINCELNGPTDFRTIAEAILNKYEVLYGIINRRINMDFSNNTISVKPKAYVSFKSFSLYFFTKIFIIVIWLLNRLS